MGTKLLIVDDEPFTVDMLETFLQLNGFETVGALNGQDGLTLVKVEQPELVILDLMLPDIEGYEVCKRIRAYPQSAGLPVLVLSARAESSSKDRAMEAGADAYLVKPVQFPQLLTELNRLLEQKKSAPAASPESPAPESFTAPSTPIPPAIPAAPETPTTQPKPTTPETPKPTPSPIPFQHSDPVNPSPAQPSTPNTTSPAQQTNGAQPPSQPSTQAPGTPLTPTPPDSKPGSLS